MLQDIECERCEQVVSYEAGQFLCAKCVVKEGEMETQRSCKTCKAFKMCNIRAAIDSHGVKLSQLIEPRGRLERFGIPSDYQSPEEIQSDEAIARKKRMLCDAMYDVVGNSCSMFVE